MNSSSRFGTGKGSERSSLVVWDFYRAAADKLTHNCVTGNYVISRNLLLAKAGD